MANQESVKDIYLKVIEATIAGSRAEFEEANSADESLLATLDILRERWQAGLLESHDFSEDPSASIRTSNPRGSVANKASATGAGAATQGQRQRQAARAAGSSADVVKAEPGILADGNGASFDPAVGLSDNSHAQSPDQAVLSSGYGGAPQQPTAVGGGGPLRGDGFAHLAEAPTVPRRDGVRPKTLSSGIPSAGAMGGATGAATGNIPQGDGAGGTSSGDEEPAAKRARHEDEQVNANEDLGSEDSDDDQSDGSEGEWDNFIVAQHDSVKKGGGNGKWKVRLKDGILHLHGREYLFSKASCDLDW
jgi:hypothetical protein